MEINRYAPLIARKKIFIHAPLETVWSIQTHINAWREWQPDISRSNLDGGLEVGSIFQWRSGGFSVTSTIQIIESLHCIGWTGMAFGSRARHLWTFQRQQDGTEVTTEESMEGWLISMLKYLRPHFLEMSLDVWLKSLKAKAESQVTQ